MSTLATGERPLVAVCDLVTSVGGVQIVMGTVLPHLADEFRVVAVDPYNHPDYLRMMRERGVETISLGSAPERRYIGGTGRVTRLLRVAGRTPWLLRTMLRLRRWINRARPDVVYFNQLRTARLLSKAIPQGGPALVYHAHGFRSAGAISASAVRLLSTRFARSMAVSKITARFMIEAGVAPDRVGVVYNAVDADSVRRRADEDGPSLPIKPDGGVVFVHVGAIEGANKAQHLAIEAMGQLPPMCHLWVCGDVAAGADRAYLDHLRERATALGVAGRVHFLGWRADVARVLRGGDVCILPSRVCESFGLALAEAMALEKACIGSTTGGIPEVIEGGVTGLVCEPTVEKLGAAMGRLAESSTLRTSMGLAGRARVESMFSVGRQAGEIAEQLRLAVSQGWGRSCN